MTNTQKKIIMLIALIGGCLLTSFISDLGNKTNDDGPSNQVLVKEVEAAREKTTIRVYVSGAVVKPGLYDIGVGSRADEAINAAGGFTELANLEKVNLARKLKDGMQVNVPTKKLGKTVSSKYDNKSSKIASEEKFSTTKKQTGNAPIININTASAAELEQLPGIGPAMAQRIILQREKEKFASVDDLLKVKGIGKAKLGRFRDCVKAE